MNNPCSMPEKVQIQLSAAGPNVQFLTAALRSWLVNHLLADEDLHDLVYLLLELGFEPLPESIEIKDFLKREMSRLASEGLQAGHLLIKLCEGLVQFYLLHHVEQTPELNQLNRFLPPGLSFSPLSGRLLFDPEHFYQPDNIYQQEQSQLFLGAKPVLAEALKSSISEAGLIDSSIDAFQGEPMTSEPVPEDAGLQKDFIEPQVPMLVDPAPEIPFSAVVSESPPADKELIDKTDPSETFSGDQPVAEKAAFTRGDQFRDIRKRRLQMLKEWGS